MTPIHHSLLTTLTLLLPLTHAQASFYKPCPLLGPFFPAPTIDPSSTSLKPQLDLFTDFIDSYIAKGNGTFGPIYPNTTSFSIGLFAGGNGEEPLFYEYHHGANGVERAPDGESVYAAGELMQVLTVLAVLERMGDEVWSNSIVDFLPELEESIRDGNDMMRTVQWKDVTIGALAGHMAGIARDSGACKIDEPCNKDTFVRKFASKPPVCLPDTTPIFSHVAFQLLAFALEAHTKTSFSTLLTHRLFSKLNLTHTSLLASNSSNLIGGGLPNTSLVGEPASLSLLTSTTDLARLGHSLLTSSLLPPATIRRWLKPFTSTSNLANSVGRPWEIYHYTNEPTDPVIDMYTKTGSLGRCSSYFGLSPDYNVGFSILAVHNEGDAPDLNAYADMVLFALSQIQALAAKQAQASFAGTYTGPSNSSLTLNITSNLPGIAITHLIVNGTDWLANIARRSGIEERFLDFRLYPTNLVEGKRRVFQGVIQDRDALVDAGTPTCVSWQGVGVLEREGLPLDEVVVEMEGGEVRRVESEVLGMRFEKVK